jgi:hypothetical protein
MMIIRIGETVVKILRSTVRRDSAVFFMITGTRPSIGSIPNALTKINSLLWCGSLAIIRKFDQWIKAPSPTVSLWRERVGHESYDHPIIFARSGCHRSGSHVIGSRFCQWRSKVRQEYVTGHIGGTNVFGNGFSSGKYRLLLLGMSKGFSIVTRPLDGRNVAVSAVYSVWPDHLGLSSI